MFFMTDKKLDSKVDKERCHFILEQQADQDPLCLPWETFLKERAVAFCVGCENTPEKLERAVTAYEDLGLNIIGARHKTKHTAFIARNQKFIDDFESGMNIR
jgi:hypothetical protein